MTAIRLRKIFALCLKNERPKMFSTNKIQQRFPIKLIRF